MKNEKSKDEKVFKRIAAELDQFRAKIIINEGYTIMPTLRVSTHGIIPYIDLVKSTDEEKKGASDLMKKKMGGIKLNLDKN